MKKALAVILSLVLLAAPFFAAIVCAKDVKGVYSSTFTAALKDKYDLLYSVEGSKIVVVGGSSLCFGLDSELMEQETGRSVVDFGLYATLGTKVMLDLSRRAINAGDTVIIAPELDGQTLSMYFNQDALLKAIDGNYYMLKDIANEDLGKLAGGLLPYISDALKLKKTGGSGVTGVYARSSFNSRGDISFPREGNVMTLGYDANRLVSLTEDIVSSDFLDYLNGYIDDCKAKGANVWFTFCPVNKSGLAPDQTEDTIYAFYEFLGKNLHCQIISDINAYILDEQYFYDTNFHLNDTGVKLRTRNLIRDLLRAEGNNKPVLIDVPDIISEPTPTPSGETGDKTDGTFIYESFGKGLAVKGVTSSAASSVTLDVPREFSGQQIYAINEGAFKNCASLTTLTIHDSITFIANGAFDAPSLTGLIIDANEAERMEAGDNIFGSRQGQVLILLPGPESYESFVSGYWWSSYADRMTIND